MIIGNFTYNQAQDTYTGELTTLTTGARRLVFQPTEAKSDKAPDYRIVGASKTGKCRVRRRVAEAQRGGPELPLG